MSNQLGENIAQGVVFRVNADQFEVDAGWASGFPDIPLDLSRGLGGEISGMMMDDFTERNDS